MPQGSEKQKESNLIAVLRSYAFEADSPSEAFECINKMIKNNATSKDYVYALCDGLKYGNWPWITHKNIWCLTCNFPTANCTCGVTK